MSDTGAEDPLTNVIANIATRLASRGVTRGLGAIAESRVGSTPTGRAALDAVGALVDEYGPDGIEAILRAIHRQQTKRIDRMVDGAKRENDADAQRALDRIRASTDSEGHP